MHQPLRDTSDWGKAFETRTQGGEASALIANGWRAMRLHTLALFLEGLVLFTVGGLGSDLTTPGV